MDDMTKQISGQRKKLTNVTEHVKNVDERLQKLEKLKLGM